MTKHNLNSLIAIIAFAFLLGYANPSVAVSLAPAIFEEYVGLSFYSVLGANNSIAESVNLSVTNEQTGYRGSGTGFATASGVLPVVSEGGLNISGGSNLSGMGGTASCGPDINSQENLNLLLKGCPRLSRSFSPLQVLYRLMLVYLNGPSLLPE